MLNNDQQSLYQCKRKRLDFAKSSWRNDSEQMSRTQRSQNPERQDFSCGCSVMFLKWKFAEALPVGFTQGSGPQRPAKDQVEWSALLLGLVATWCEGSKTIICYWKPWDIFRTHWICCPCEPPLTKTSLKINDPNSISNHPRHGNSNINGNIITILGDPQSSYGAAAHPAYIHRYFM